MFMAIATGITIEEFERLPAALAHNRELINGELVDVSGNTLGHNRLRDCLVALLIAPVEEQNIGMIVSEQEFDFDGNPVDGGNRPIYSERFIHSEVYKARPDVNAAIHSHSPTVIPFSVTQVRLRPVHNTASFLAPEVPVFEMRKVAGMTNNLVTDSARGKALVEALGNRPVALLRGHGNVVVGPELRRTVARAIYTEVNARMLLQAVMLGGPITFIDAEEAKLIESNRETMGAGHGVDRIWQMWAEEASRGGGEPAR